MNVTILGKSNSTIAIMLDALCELYKRYINVDIIQNIYVEDDLKYKLEKINDIKVNIINSDNWNGLFEYLLIGSLQAPTKKKIYDHFNKVHSINEEHFSSFSHPNSVISLQNEIGNGVFIGPGCVLAPYVSIGNLVTINRNVSVGHHTKIGKFSTINPGCNIGGRTSIGSSVIIGMGANIINDVNIGDNTIVGAGSLVTKTLPSNVMAYGVPAKVIKEI
jgi:sugar O-acyltransferase (sialic acid O-acetyltransferase NeuD family)